MAVSDPIADFLTRVRNAIKAYHRYVDIPYSKIKLSIIEILKENGLIQGYLVKKDGSIGTIRVFLKYSKTRESAIQGIKRISKPGLRRYVKNEEIPHYFGNLGLNVISTSQGVLSGQEAQKRKIGGELLCKVW